MTGEEKFSFDLEGYLIVKNVLSADEVEFRTGGNRSKS